MFKLCLATASAMLLASVAGAQDAPSVTFNVGTATDYVFRGVSQTGGDPQGFGGVDVTSGALYLGVWASNVDFGDGTDAEIDLYAGVRPEVAGWTLNVGAIYYAYPGQPGGADYDYLEAKVAASRSFGPATVGGAVFYSPDYFGSEDEATYVEANAAYRLADRWTVSGALARQWVASSLDYTTWNLGATFALTDRLSLDGRYYDTDASRFGDAYDGRAVASLKAVF